MEALPKKDVLVVDDDDAIRGMLRAAMLHLNLTCDVAVDGVAALECLKHAQYALVLTDLMMPRLDGIGFVQALSVRQRANSERPVIVLMTAFPERGELPVIGELVQAIIRKPFDIRDLAEIVQSCVAMRRHYEATAS